MAVSFDELRGRQTMLPTLLPNMVLLTLFLSCNISPIPPPVSEAWNMDSIAFSSEWKFGLAKKKPARPMG